MKNNIVFTQDLPGEREWLKTRFPDCKILETEFSGKWPDPPFTQSYDAVYEISPDSNVDVSAIDTPKYKSLYQVNTDFISPKWYQSNRLLINNLKFESSPQSNMAQVIHFPRSGTVFLESILFNRCNYARSTSRNSTLWPKHYMVGGGPGDKDFYNLIHEVRPDIFFCYRKNWWEWFVSYHISIKFGAFHYNDNVDWNSLDPFEITLDHINDTIREITSSWNAMCHFRTIYPNLNFYIFEFSDLIQHQHLTSHTKINYNKKRLVKNYESVRKLFESTYNPQFEQWERNALSHLQTMNCKVLKNFDSLLNYNK